MSDQSDNHSHRNTNNAGSVPSLPIAIISISNTIATQINPLAIDVPSYSFHSEQPLRRQIRSGVALAERALFLGFRVPTLTVLKQCTFF